jgi:preprotein translocase subunit SecB
MADGDDTEGPAGGTQVQVSMIAQYVKDLSFENPNAPASLQKMQAGKPDVSVNVTVNAKRLGDDGYEVSLKITTESKVDKELAFIAELDYAALWGVRNVPEDQMQPLLLVECPRLMFPFARRILADAIRDGGFPPIMLDPIDFAGLYRQAQQNEKPEKLN